MASGLVSVLITTYNSGCVLPSCLESLQRQEYAPIEVIIVDNASTDATRKTLASVRADYRVILNESNIGFAAAQNQALRQARGEWVLSLNPDAVLSASFIGELIGAAAGRPSVGSVCGKLLRWVPGGDPTFTRIIDSTGIYFQKNLRHLDRGAEELDRGQYDSLAYVFGSTGAAALYRRQMIEQVSVHGEFFDEDFFAYREDADVAWRAQLMGWQCVYTPRAVGWHVRRVTPACFKTLPLLINWHSVKNRFLMRAKNISLPLYLRLLPQATCRDAMVFGYAMLMDRRLLSALSFLWQRREVTWQKRKWIQSHRRVSDAEIGKWFSDIPVAQALELQPTPLPEDEVPVPITVEARAAD